jgi:hypothetical protein
MFAIASYFVTPWLMQLRIAGHSVIHTPSSSRLRVTLKFMVTP